MSTQKSMIIQFVTRRKDHQLRNNPLIQVIPPEEYDLHSHLLTQNGSVYAGPFRYPGWHVLGYDIETRFSNPELRSGGLLLSAFCNHGENVLVIDNTSVDNKEIFKEDVLRRCLFIAHNADFEARWGVSTGFMPVRFGCTMVNGKRLLSGQKGFRHDLISEINRWLGPEAVPIWMEKDIRSEFKDLEFFYDYHILYNAADVIRLKPLYFAQLAEAERFNQIFLHNTINSRIITPIAEAEITGIRHDTEKWKGITEQRRVKAKQICDELNQLVVEKYELNPASINPEARKKLAQQEGRQLRRQSRIEKLRGQLVKLEALNKTHLKSYRVSLEQLDKLLQEESHQELDSLSPPLNFGVNWGSSQQVLAVFRQSGCPVPEAKDKKSRAMKAGVGKEARANWFVNFPNSSYLPLMKLFDQFKKVEHNIKAFGDKWVSQYVRNGRAYTLLDQAGTDTGRFSSGDKKPAGVPKEYANKQQIPKRGGKEYRECFIADDGRSIITLDYKNCEGVIMISLSKDLNMKRITEMDDQHSYLGTLAWRAVYKHRYERTGDPKWLDLSLNYEMNKSTPEKEEERTKFKNSGGLFPVAYGVTANKVAGAAQLTEAEGQAMIDAIKAQIPNVTITLDTKSKEASTYGYVIHNERTGSRRWFTPILDNLHYKFPVSKSEIIEAEMAARNSPIQGTNSDIVKEAIAMIALWIKLYKLDIRFLLTVHDELVYDCPTEKAEEYTAKISELMRRAAKNYLIPEIDMDVDAHYGPYWGYEPPKK